MRRLKPAKVNHALLKRLHAKDPARQKKMWNYSSGDPRSFKNTVTTQLKKIQRKRCAFCGVKILETKPHRDHIAPKGAHPEFTFFPKNIVLTCYRCNSDQKGTTDTILVKSRYYGRCTFSIVHPYFDNPTHHIVYVGGNEKLLVQAVNHSPKGLRTIEVFGLDDPDLAMVRYRDSVVEKKNSHFPGRWQRGMLLLANRNIKLKLRS
jgi:uncharacterized protein (TIGR02646 family)